MNITELPLFGVVRVWDLKLPCNDKQRQVRTYRCLSLYTSTCRHLSLQFLEKKFEGVSHIVLGLLHNYYVCIQSMCKRCNNHKKIISYRMSKSSINRQQLAEIPTSLHKHKYMFCKRVPHEVWDLYVFDGF